MGGIGGKGEGGGEREIEAGRDRRRERVEGGGKERNHTKRWEGERGSQGRERGGDVERDKEGGDQYCDKEREDVGWM